LGQRYLAIQRSVYSTERRVDLIQDGIEVAYEWLPSRTNRSSCRITIGMSLSHHRL
jgi:hypothetical protein